MFRLSASAMQRGPDKQPQPNSTRSRSRPGQKHCVSLQSGLSSPGSPELRQQALSAARTQSDGATKLGGGVPVCPPELSVVVRN